jgi:ribose transport system permease protein
MSERTDGSPEPAPEAQPPAGRTSTVAPSGGTGVEAPPADEHTRIEEAAAAAGTARQPSWVVGRLTEVRNLGLLGVLILLGIVGVITTDGQFLTTNNIINILVSASIIGVVTVGMTFVIIGGGIDLSVGALVALASVWATTLQTQSYGPFVMVTTALLVGMGAGLINGALIAYGQLVPFIVTLAMLVSARGLAQAMSDRRTQLVTESGITNIATTEVLGIPLLVYLFAAVVAVGWVVLNRTTFGRRTFAIGGNSEAARLAGINVKRHTALLYVLSGLCCGIAAIMIMARTTTGSSTHGDLYELDAIAAVIIGGTLLTGGRGTLIGSVLGVLVFTTITNLFVLNNLATDVQNIAKGLIIIAAVLLQRRGRSAAP